MDLGRVSGRQDGSHPRRANLHKAEVARRINAGPAGRRYSICAERDLKTIQSRLVNRIGYGHLLLLFLSRWRSGIASKGHVLLIGPHLVVEQEHEVQIPDQVAFDDNRPKI